jgi:hypothetical protein|nr:MAG TPA: zinc finger Ran-binding domain-containing protein [Caudoviricetes sp.]
MRNGKIICPICNSDNFHYDRLQEIWLCENGHPYKGKRGHIGFAGRKISHRTTHYNKSQDIYLELNYFKEVSDNKNYMNSLRKIDSNNLLGCTKLSAMGSKKNKIDRKFGGLSAGKASKKNKTGRSF